MKNNNNNRSNENDPKQSSLSDTLQNIVSKREVNQELELSLDKVRLIMKYHTDNSSLEVLRQVACDFSSAINRVFDTCLMHLDS